MKRKPVKYPWRATLLFTLFAVSSQSLPFAQAKNTMKTKSRALSKKGDEPILQKKTRGLSPLIKVEAVKSSGGEEHWVLSAQQKLNETSKSSVRVSHLRWLKHQAVRHIDVTVVPEELSLRTCKDSKLRSFSRFLVGGMYLENKSNRRVLAGTGIGKFAHEKTAFQFFVAFSFKENGFVLDEHRQPGTEPVQMLFFKRLGPVKLGDSYRMQLRFSEKTAKIVYKLNQHEDQLDLSAVLPDWDGGKNWSLKRSRRDIGLALFNPLCPGKMVNSVRFRVTRRLW